MTKEDIKLEKLLKLTIEPPPRDFKDFWKKRYRQMLELSPRPKLLDAGLNGNVRVFDLEYRSPGKNRIRGWLTLPALGMPKRAFVVLHGYDGRTGPDFDEMFGDAAAIFPCCRGLGRSQSSTIPSDPQKHVLHGLESRESYVLGGCVEDAWMAISSLTELFPELQGKIYMTGLSFGGGIAALAAAIDKRISRLHLNVASFGAYRARLNIPTIGSAAALQKHYGRHGEKTLKVLDYFDAAHAAAHIDIPVHCACALEDKVVAPESQFAIYNRLRGPKQLMVLNCGHCNYPERAQQMLELKEELTHFFCP